MPKPRPFALAAVLLPCLLASFAPSLAASAPPEAEVYWSAIEMQGKLVGFSRTEQRPGDAAAALPRQTISDSQLKLTALGQPFDIRVQSTMSFDAATDAPIETTMVIRRGEDEQKVFVTFSPGKAEVSAGAGTSARTVELGPEVLVGDGIDMSFALDALDGEEMKEADFRTFEAAQGKIHDQHFTRAGRETLNFAGEPHDCLIVDTLDRTFGLRGKVWIDRSNGRALRIEAGNGVTVYLADESVKDRVQRGDMDSMILGKVDVAIPNFQEISKMKVRAKVRSIGEWLTADGLSVPGQTFDGTVKENLVEGVFEIAWPRYDGAGAPGLGTDWSGDGSLERYLEPEDMIESDDPEITSLAGRLTDGATDSWDAARRLADWVGKNIAYQIPGGSARHTLDSRRGECGSHARLLTALGRASGIPTRLVTGGLYNPNLGGSFGQHAWNEFFMGEAGWIPVDSTVRESDYIDAGHIRFGEMTTFNPIEIKVLDYVAGERRMGQEPATLAQRAGIPWQAGKEYVFRYLVDGNQVGTETLRLISIGDDGTVTATTTLALGVLNAAIDWSVDGAGAPLAFHANGTAGAQKVLLDCQFTGEKVEVKIDQAGQSIERSVDLPQGVRLIANNNLGLMALIVADAPPTAGETRAFKVFHPSSSSVLSAELTTREMETIDWNGEQVEARHVEMSLAGMPLEFWLDGAGHLLRNSQQAGKVVVELTALP